MQASQKDQNQGAENPILPTAHEAQREELARPGEYLCETCKNQFHYAVGATLCCPKCKNDKTDALIPIYTEEDPATDEMLSKDEFTAGD